MSKELIDNCYSCDSESEEVTDGRETRGEEDQNGPSKGHPAPLRTSRRKIRTPGDIIRALTPGKPPATTEPTSVKKTPKKSTAVAATNS